MQERSIHKALVTGATGFLGANLVRYLNELNVPVRIARRASSSLSLLKNCRYEDIVDPLDNTDRFEQTLGECDTVFHLAGCVTLAARNQRELERANIHTTRTVVKALLKKSGVRLVHCSTVGAVGFSKEPVVFDEESTFNAAHIAYFRTKREGEDLVREAVRKGLDAVIVNPSTIVGPFGLREFQRRAVHDVTAGKLLFYPPGGTCIVHVNDVTQGMVLAARRGRPGERYILGGHNLSFKQYFDVLAGKAGAPPPFLRLPAFLLPFIGGLVGLVTGRLGADTGKLAAGFGYYSSEKAQRALGYRMTPLDQIANDLYLAFGERQQSASKKVAVWVP